MDRHKEIADIADKLNGKGPTMDRGLTPSEGLTLLDEIRVLRGALQMWVDYDNLDEADFSEAGPMLHYAEAIEKARHLLNSTK